MVKPVRFGHGGRPSVRAEGQRRPRRHLEGSFEKCRATTTNEGVRGHEAAVEGPSDIWRASSPSIRQEQNDTKLVGNLRCVIIEVLKYRWTMIQDLQNQ